MSIQRHARPFFRVLGYFLRQYKFNYAVILVITVIAALLESLSVAAFFPMLSSVFSVTSGETDGILGITQDMAKLIPIGNQMLAGAMLLLGVFVCKALVGFLRDLMIGRTGARVLYDVRKRIMERHASATYQFHLENKQGTLLYNTIDAPTSVGTVLLVGSQMVVSILKVTAIIAMLVSIFPVAALSVVGFGGLYYAFVHVLSRKISYQIGRSKARTASEQLAITNEFLNGFRQIIAFNTAQRWLDKFDIENRYMRQLITRDITWTAVPRPLMEISGIALMLGLVLLLSMTSPGQLVENLPALGVFAVALVQLMPPLGSISATRIDIMGNLPNVEITYNTLTGPIPLKQSGTSEIQLLERSINFENVSFAHKDRDLLFDGLNLSIQRGEVTGLVGPSGVGKTTIINLVLGLFDPTEGTIRVDDRPLSDIREGAWLNKIGFVSQDPFIFNSTIWDNIVFGRLGHSQEQVIESARIANAHDFIENLPLGYQTIVGDRGMRLSGGQQQRLAIARAVLDSPEILIFDEATSSLDTISERQVQEAIDNASADRTVIIIAHRLSTIKGADKIVVFDNGKVVEEGKHRDLLLNQGPYSKLVNSVPD